ncbi:MAG: DUF1851 domain-containing protein [Caulobacter sp.]|nr:DUF1851 domain-containing protein [Caulobacter sp.]
MFSRLFGRKSKTLDQQGVYLDGAYRLHQPADTERFTELARTAFPAFSDRIECFGADWLGRQFARDRGRLQNGEPLILMLEPGTGEALEIPANFAAFHERELIDEPDAVAAASFFEEWISAGGARPKYDQCIAYKLPLFIGGSDEVSNLHLSDLDVYWTVAAQLLAKTRGLPEGTIINRVALDD